MWRLIICNNQLQKRYFAHIQCTSNPTFHVGGDGAHDMLSGVWDVNRIDDEEFANDECHDIMARWVQLGC